MAQLSRNQIVSDLVRGVKSTIAIEFIRFLIFAFFMFHFFRYTIVYGAP